MPAALGLALAAGLGVAAFLEDLRTFHFGWRQFAAVAAAVGIALPVIGFAADTLDGRWGMSNDDWPTRFAWMDEERPDGDFKVLWVGDPTIMPTDAKVVDGVGYGLTRQGPGDARGAVGTSRRSRGTRARGRDRTRPGPAHDPARAPARARRACATSR